MNPPKFQLVGLALVALVAGWAGTRVYQRLAAPSPQTAPSLPIAATLPAAALPAAETGAAPPAPKIPDRLPEFALTDRTGKSVSASSWPDKSLIINFWATWCAPCRREIPLLQTLAADWRERRVEVVGVAVDHRDQVLAYAAKMHIDYPLLIGEQDALDVAAAFGFDDPVFPFTVFTDRRGEVVTLFVGELHKPQADLILKVVDDLNQDRLQLTAARRTITAGLRALGS